MPWSTEAQEKHCKFIKYSSFITGFSLPSGRGQTKAISLRRWGLGLWGRNPQKSAGWEQSLHPHRGI